MRLVGLTIAVAALALTGLAAPSPAAAGGFDRDHGPSVRGLWPGGPDPYEYRWAPQAYYPYYNSGYWVPRAQMRYRNRKPLLIGPYFSSWGYPVHCGKHDKCAKRTPRWADRRHR